MILVDFTNGIDHPEFYADCTRCTNRHGLYRKLALYYYVFVRRALTPISRSSEHT